MIVMDVVVFEFYVVEEKVYYFYKLIGDKLFFEDMVNYWVEWCDKYLIFFIEDGLDEDDWDVWKLMMEKVGDKVQLVGDDFFVINIECLQRGIENGSVNLILIKVNQIGFLMEIIDVVNLVMCNVFISVMSYCFGEIEDVIIVDLVVGLNIGQIKIGLLFCFDCVVKYN